MRSLHNQTDSPPPRPTVGTGLSVFLLAVGAYAALASLVWLME